MGGGVMRTAGKSGASIAGYLVRRAASAASTRISPASASFPFDEASPSAAISLDVGSRSFAPALWAAWSDEEDCNWCMGEDLDDDVLPCPRRIFGPAPGIEEALEATSDLKEALDNASWQLALGTCGEDSGQIVAGRPGSVFQAFSFLQQNAEAQNMVASIASDQKVWAAVLNNEKVKEFCQKQLPTNANSVESAVENLPPSDSPKHFSSGWSWFMDTVKNKAMELANSTTDFFQSLYHTGGTSKEPRQESGDKSGEGFFSKGVGVDMMVLVVAIIMIVLFKRI